MARKDFRVPSTAEVAAWAHKLPYTVLFLPLTDANKTNTVHRTNLALPKEQYIVLYTGERTGYG